MFQVLYRPDVPVEDLPHINQNIKARIRRAIEARLTRAPEDHGKPLVGNLKGYWSLRVGDHRIVYIIEATKVKIIQIADRRDAYREGILEARRRGWLT